VTNATLMTTRRENYTITEKFKIIKRVKNGKLKTSLFHKCGILEWTICGWMKTEDKLHSYGVQVRWGRAAKEED
jgi:hypothetical protein